MKFNTVMASAACCTRRSLSFLIRMPFCLKSPEVTRLRGRQDFAIHGSCTQRGGREAFEAGFGKLSCRSSHDGVAISRGSWPRLERSSPWMALVREPAYLRDACQGLSRN